MYKNCAKKWNELVDEGQRHSAYLSGNDELSERRSYNIDFRDLAFTDLRRF
jgi:hypothetical protein